MMLGSCMYLNVILIFVATALASWSDIGSLTSSSVGGIFIMSVYTHSAFSSIPETK